MRTAYLAPGVPVRPSSLMAKHVMRAVRAAKIKTHVSWHVFRHSYASPLKGNGGDIKVVQESHRHANFQITADTFVQAIPQAVLSAHSRVVEQLAAGADGAD